MMTDSTPFFVTLQERGLIHIEGEDRHTFLQGLITNDINKVSAGSLLYTCLLTPQGKFLHDFFIHEGDGFFLLDCEGGARAQDLYARLNKHRLRSKVTLSVEDHHPVYAVFGAEDGLPDPRHPAMGCRSFTKPSLPEQSFDQWDERRIHLGIPDGSRDAEIGKSTLDELGLDQWHAIDWDKGCYMGQELTARMKHRGLGKKHLRPLLFDDAPPPPFTDLVIHGTVIGTMRSACGQSGLGVIKDERLEDLKHGTESRIRLLGQ